MTNHYTNTSAKKPWWISLMEVWISLVFTICKSLLRKESQWGGCFLTFQRSFGDHWYNTELDKPYIWPRMLTLPQSTFLGASLICTDSGEQFQIRNTLAEEKVCSQTIHKQTNKQKAMCGEYICWIIYSQWIYSANSTKGPAFFSRYIKIFSYDNHGHKCYLWLMLLLLSSFLSGP